MAESPAHRFGQIIGDTMEAAIRPVLQSVATDLGLYLDGKGVRAARGTKRKVAWVDGKGNTHDLDYVLESDGSAGRIGNPRAFIEIAWRRYTKHSRNKAQEIQGAILPLADHYRAYHPFLGVVLGGEFTSGSLTQLKSHGFTVLYFPYESLVEAFRSVGIDASSDEATSIDDLASKVRAYDALTTEHREAIASHLREGHVLELNAFVETLRRTLTRTIASVYVLPLHGAPCTLVDIRQAIAYIESFDEVAPTSVFQRYEVGVRYSNGDEIRGQFEEKATAVAFLQGMR